MGAGRSTQGLAGDPLKPRIAILAALDWEAAALAAAAGPGVAVIASGAGPAAAAAAARRAVGDGARLLISCGSAGGLIDCAPGLIVVAQAVIGEDGKRIDLNQSLVEYFSRSFEDCGAVSSGPLASPGHALSTPEAKRALHRDSGALAVDMESGTIADVAMRAGVACVALRVVLDPADARVPPAALAGMHGTRTRIGPVLAGLVKSPRDLPDMLRLARGAAIVRNRLRCCARHLARISEDFPDVLDP